MLTMSLVLSLGGLLAGAAEGENKPKPAVPPAGAPPAGVSRIPEAYKKYDKNGDGKLDEQERAAAMKARGEKGDGQKPGAGREEAMKRFDKDGDGKLNDEERAAARKAMEERQKNK